MERLKTFFFSSMNSVERLNLSISIQGFTAIITMREMERERTLYSLNRIKPVELFRPPRYSKLFVKSSLGMIFKVLLNSGRSYFFEGFSKVAPNKYRLDWGS